MLSFPSEFFSSEVTTLQRDENTYIIIIRPHRSTTHVDAAYCYRPSSVVSLSVSLFVCLPQREPCNNG